MSVHDLKHFLHRFGAAKSASWRLGPMLLAALVASATARAQDFQMTEQQFNSWLTNGNSSPEDQARTQAQTEIKAIQRVCGLADQQRLKLELAMQGDVDRFETSIAELREEMVGNTYDQDEINDVYQRIQPYAQRCQQGLLGEDSLFHKCLATTLDADQFKKYDEAQFRRRCANYEAKIKMYVALLDRAAPMTQKQRKLLVDRMLADTYPPKRSGQQDLYYVMAQASKLPLDEFAKEFDEAQLKVLRVAFMQGRGYDQFLKQQGYEPDERRAPRDLKPSDDPHKSEQKPLGAKEET
jgi:hypothetical protein